MSKDAVATMGGILPDDAGGRDAVHVAVFSAVSGDKLFPSQDVAVIQHGDPDTTVSASGETVGIVDPYLKRPVNPGERFWVYLYPRSITGLSHRWSHPAFEASATTYAPPSQKLQSQQWIEDFAGRYGFTADRMIEAARDYIKTGDYWCDGGTFEGETVPDEFWDHYQRATGEMVDSDDRHNFFTCSC